MIKNVYIDGVKITGDHILVRSISDSATASIDVSDYSRGGRSGVALSRPFYRNFVIAMEFTLFGDPSTDIITRRDSFLSYFRINPDKEAVQTKVFKFELSNGLCKEIPAVVSVVKSQMNPENINHYNVLVTIRTEKEYFVNTVENSQRVDIYQGGGMAIPMAIDMDMSNSIGTQEVVMNNAGSSEFYPVIRVHAPLNTFTIKSNTLDKQIDYSGNLTTGYIDLDMYNKTALLNGATNILDDITGEWFWLEVGDNRIILQTSSGTGYADFTYQDAFRGL